MFGEVSEVLKSLKSHKRYHLRLTAISSILLGSILNFTFFLVAFIHNRMGFAPRYLAIWASIVVSLDLIALAALSSYSPIAFNLPFLVLR